MPELMEEEEFKEFLLTNFFKWSSNRTRSKAAWLDSLEQWTKQEWNDEYNRRFTREASES